MKPIPGFEGYFISEYGVVYNAKGYAMKDYDNGNGYRLVRLYTGRVNGKSTYKNKYIHRLVAESFIPNPGNLPQVDHKDDNKSNNCIANLKWVTAQRNLEKQNAKWNILLDPEGQVNFVYNLKKFARDNNIHPAALQDVVKHRSLSAKGYKCPFNIRSLE